MTRLLTSLILATFAMTTNAQPQLRADNIDEVLKAMTLEEKAQILVGGGNDSFVGSGAMLGHQEKLVAGRSSRHHRRNSTSRHSSHRAH